jgi:hypothetical protein
MSLRFWLLVWLDWLVISILNEIQIVANQNVPAILVNAVNPANQLIVAKIN